MLGLGAGEILLIGAALVLLFGAKKIPGIARGIGEGIRNFKGETKGKEVGRGDDAPALEDGDRSGRGGE